MPNIYCLPTYLLYRKTVKVFYKNFRYINMTMNNPTAQSIGDVAQLLDVPTHTLRYWEKEFGKFLHPERSFGRQRKYLEYDINLLKRIKRMLREEKYSIAGAKQKLSSALLDEKETGKQEMLLKIMDFIQSNNLVTF